MAAPKEKVQQVEEKRPPTDRILDHVAEARELLALNMPTTFAVQSAQAHAFLAIAEQLEKAVEMLTAIGYRIEEGNPR